MHYALKFLDSSEEMIRALNIEATDHDSAISYSCAQSIYFDMPIELWRENDLIVPMTPMTARLYLPDNGERLGLGG